MGQVSTGKPGPSESTALAELAAQLLDLAEQAVEPLLQVVALPRGARPRAEGGALLVALVLPHRPLAEAAPAERALAEARTSRTPAVPILLILAVVFPHRALAKAAEAPTEALAPAALAKATLAPAAPAERPLAEAALAEAAAR